MKRLLYMTQYYVDSDQAGGGGTRHHEHIRGLMRLGYQVTLITSYVEHSRRIVPPEYEDTKIAHEQDGDLTIFRTYAYPNYGGDIRSRMLNYLSFMFYAIIAGLRAPRCDLVYASSPSLFVGLAGYVLSRLRRIPYVFEVRDLWPETAVAVGALRQPALVKAVAWLAHFLYRHAVLIVAVTEGVKEGIVQTGIHPSKVIVIPNGVDDDLYATLSPERAAQIRQEYEWGDRFVALYAGCLARSDGLPAIVHAAAILSESTDFLVVFLGNGEAKPQLLELKDDYQLSNVMFIPALPKRRVPDFITASDVCLMPVKRDDFFHMHLPNKLFDYMAGERAVVAAVPPGEAQALVERADAGVVIPPEDAKRLASALLDLHSDPATRQWYGRNGRRYVINHYLRSQSATRVAKALDGVLLQEGKMMAHEDQPLSTS